MNENMTVAEIAAKYPSEWILVEDPVTDESLQVRSGKVLCHSADRDEVYLMAVKLRPRRSAILNTREIPEGTAIIL